MNLAAILKQLGYPEGTLCDTSTLKRVERAWQEVSEVAHFQYIYAEFSNILPFLQHPAYANFLHNHTHYLLCATTLGQPVDRRLQQLQARDLSYAVIYNATAGVFLEEKADDFEATLPFTNRSYRFCPGYAGTNVADNQLIAEAVRANKIGITFLTSGVMIPSKSMTGILLLAETATKSCSSCVAATDCAFRARGTTCYTE